MEITPNEIRNQQFSSSFRGYNKEEVESFKETVAAALEDTKVALLKLSEEKSQILIRYQELKNLEDTIRMAMVEAQKGAEMILSNAKKESELLISEAHQMRDRAIDEKNRHLARAEMRLSEIEFARRSLYAKLRADLGAHIKLLESINPFTETTAARDESGEPKSIDDIDRIVEQFKIETGISGENKNEQS
jgi:cell division initiation protein